MRILRTSAENGVCRIGCFRARTFREFRKSAKTFLRKTGFSGNFSGPPKTPKRVKISAKMANIRVFREPQKVRKSEISARFGPQKAPDSSRVSTR